MILHGHIIIILSYNNSSNNHDTNIWSYDNNTLSYNNNTII